METRVRKWGNSLALRIPRPLAVEVGLVDGQVVELTLEEGRLTVIPIAPAPLSLEGMLGKITVENLHDEVDMGTVAGGEVW